MAHPRFAYPMYEPLHRYDREWMVPGLGLIKRPDMATLLRDQQPLHRGLPGRAQPRDGPRAAVARVPDRPARHLLLLVLDRRARARRRPARAAVATAASCGAHVDQALDGRLVFLVRGDLIRRYPGCRRARGAPGDRTTATRRPTAASRCSSRQRDLAGQDAVPRPPAAEHAAGRLRPRRARRSTTARRDVVVHAVGEPDRAALRPRPVAATAALTRDNLIWDDFGVDRARPVPRRHRSTPTWLRRTGVDRRRARVGRVERAGRLPALPAAGPRGVPGHADGRGSGALMADLERIRRTTADAAAERERARQRELAELSAKLRGRARAAGRAAGDRRHAAGARRRRARSPALLGARARVRSADRPRCRIAASASSTSLLGDDIDLEGDVPLVLLPVRIEVRSTADQAALRVRIFHDAVHAETLDEGVSRRRASPPGMAYWTDGLGERRHAGAVAGAARRGGRSPGAVGRRGAAADEPRRPARRRAARSPTPRAAQRPRQPSRARCPTGSSSGSSRTAPRRVDRRTAARSPTSCPSGSTDATSSTALAARRRGPAAGRRVAALAGRLRRGRARRHGRHRRRCRVPGQAVRRLRRLRRARRRSTRRRGAARLEQLRALAPLHRRRRVPRPGHADEQHRVGAHRVEPAHAARPAGPRPDRPRSTPAPTRPSRRRRSASTRR